MAAPVNVRQQFTAMPPSQGPLVGPDGCATLELQRWMHDMWRRVGAGSVAVQDTGVVLLDGDGAARIVPATDPGASGGSVPSGGGSIPSTTTPGGPPQTIAPTASPFGFTASTAGTLCVDSGKVEIGRSGQWFVVGLAGGALPLAAADSARITWFAGAPPAIEWLPA